MNRMFFALVASGFCCLLASADGADKKNAPPPPPTGTKRVAVVNLSVVLGRYEKAKDFKDEIARDMKQIQAEGKKLSLDLTAWQSALQKNEFKNGTKEQYEEKVINGRRRLEDLSRLASLRVGKTQQVHLESLWREMQDAVKTYSGKHKIELVFAYGDPLDNDGVLAFPNIDRKLRAADQGGAVPFFMAPSADISGPVADLLNQKYRAEKTKAPQRKPLDLE